MGLAYSPLKRKFDPKTAGGSGAMQNSPKGRRRPPCGSFDGQTRENAASPKMGAMSTKIMSTFQELPKETATTAIIAL